MLDAEYSAFESTLNSSIVSYRIQSLFKMEQVIAPMDRDDIRRRSE